MTTLSHSEKIKLSWRNPEIRALRCARMKGVRMGKPILGSKLGKRQSELTKDICDRKLSSGELAAKYECTKEAIQAFIHRHGLRPLNIYPRHSREERVAKSNRHSGSNSHFWKGGLTKENAKIRAGIQNRLWREAVFARDNYTCQECLTHGGRLHAHHIKPFAKYPELRFAIDNGKTMCVSCHGLFHKLNFGINHNTK